jgi:hypothetical protein
MIDLQETTGMSSGCSTHLLRAEMWGIFESGSGSGELAPLTSRSFTNEENTMRMKLIGTGDVGARTVELID